jgi:miniconductance mechanosensitive channel
MGEFFKTKALEFMGSSGIPEHLVEGVYYAVFLFGIFLLCVLAEVLTRRVLVSALSMIIKKSAYKWDDELLKNNVFKKLPKLAPPLVIYLLIPLALPTTSAMIQIIQSLMILYVISVALMMINYLLNAVRDIMLRTQLAEQIPVKGIIQAVKIVTFFVGGILILSALTTKTPLYLLSGLGALTAVLLLIFKDSILGLVAGMQLTANRMIKEGDWIEMEKFGADGDVIDVSLTTVKVQNFDKTISYIPTYELVSGSFRNWQGMKDSGGRRIKRAINIDINTIKFCDEEMIENFSKIQYIKEYIDNKRVELTEYNKEHNLNESLVNGRRLTNVGTFRAYIEAYLHNHPLIHEDMTFLVRQLAPTQYGLPIQIYVFTTDTVWANHEAIQADIFDHLLAALSGFELSVYQVP